MPWDAAATKRDYRAWHDAYDDPASPLAQRLKVVQARLTEALDAAPPGPLRVIGMCAGQGGDLIPVLAQHPRRHEVSARLVELDPHNASVARHAAAAAALPRVEVVTGDAALADAYRGLVPAQIVLACGVFGNIPDSDVQHTIGCLTYLCAAAGTVVWTRGRSEPDLVPQICRWLSERDFELLWVSGPGFGYGLGMPRFRSQPQPLARGTRMFSFVR